MILALAEPWLISAIKSFLIINLILLVFSYMTLAERKVMARMQLRYGPNRAGPKGMLQPFADLIKLIRKEAFAPTQVVALPYIVAPILSAFTALAAFSVIPFGPGWHIGEWAVTAGRLARMAGRIPARHYARASSPREGLADFGPAA